MFPAPLGGGDAGVTLPLGWQRKDAPNEPLNLISAWLQSSQQLSRSQTAKEEMI